MKWLTRKNPRIDRISSAWLIQRFVDPEAEFIFAEAADLEDVMLQTGATPYDVPGAELGDVDGRCTFESVLLAYHLDDPVLAEMARIIRGADQPAPGEVPPPESAGLAAIVHGFATRHPDDDEFKLRHELPMHDALYSFLQQRMARKAS